MQITSRCKCVDLDVLNPNEFYGHFVFTSLEKSEGATIGNMLRRTLLSNLYGFRIVGVRICGINNEFTPMPGVREDLLEIILNLKEIIILNEAKTDQSCFGRLKVQGPAIVTAGSLILPKDVHILNPSSHLLTISDESLIELEVKIESGKSYILAKDQKLEGSKDFIPIDSNFAPVLKANWYLKSLPQDVDNKNEELHLEIFTNGTLLPHQALLQARKMVGYLLSSILKMEFPCFDVMRKKNETTKSNQILEEEEIIKDLNIKSKSLKSATLISEKVKSSESKGGDLPEKVSLSKTTENGISEEKLFKRVTDMESGSLKGLGLSNRIINALKKVNINYTWDLMKYPSPNLITIEGLGPKSVQQIKNKLDLFSEPPTE